MLIFPINSKLFVNRNSDSVSATTSWTYCINIIIFFAIELLAYKNCWNLFVNKNTILNLLIKHICCSIYNICHQFLFELSIFISLIPNSCRYEFIEQKSISCRNVARPGHSKNRSAIDISFQELMKRKLGLNFAHQFVFFSVTICQTV